MPDWGNVDPAYWQRITQAIELQRAREEEERKRQELAAQMWREPVSQSAPAIQASNAMPTSRTVAIAEPVQPEVRTYASYLPQMYVQEEERPQPEPQIVRMGVDINPYAAWRQGGYESQPFQPAQYEAPQIFQQPLNVLNQWWTGTAQPWIEQQQEWAATAQTPGEAILQAFQPSPTQERSYESPAWTWARERMAQVNQEIDEEPDYNRRPIELPGLNPVLDNPIVNPVGFGTKMVAPALEGAGELLRRAGSTNWADEFRKIGSGIGTTLQAAEAEPWSTPLQDMIAPQEGQWAPINQYVSNEFERAQIPPLGVLAGAVGESANRTFNAYARKTGQVEPLPDYPGYTPFTPGASIQDWINATGNLIDQRVAEYRQAAATFDNLSPDVQEVVKPAFIMPLYGSTKDALNKILAKDNQLNQLSYQIAQAQAAGDDLRAAELGAEYERLQNTTPIDIIDGSMNIWAQIVGGFADPLSVGMVLAGTSKYVPNLMRSAAQSRYLNVTEAQALSNLAYGQDLMDPYIKAITGGKKVNLFPTQDAQPASRNLLNRLNVFAKTEFSKTNTDASDLWTTVARVLSNGNGTIVTSKPEILRRLNLLVSNPTQLVREGITGYGTIGNVDTANRLPMLRGTDWTTLPSLAGEVPEIQNATKFLSDVYTTLWQKAAQFNGLSSVKPGQRTLVEEAPLIGPVFKAARWPSDAMRAIMSFNYLGLSPANWIRNATGGHIMMWGSNSGTFSSIDQLADMFRMRTGISGPTTRLYEATTGEKVAKGVTAGEAIREGAREGQRGTFWFRGPKAWQDFNKALFDIAYGQTQIPLPGGRSIGVGEQPMYTKGAGTTFDRAWRGTWNDVTQGDFAQSVRGMAEQPYIDRVVRWVQENGKNLSKAELSQRFRQMVNSDTIPIDLSDMGIPYEIVGLDERRAINALLRDALPEQADEVAVRIHNILMGARARNAELLSVSPMEVVPYDWMNVEVPAFAADLVENAVPDAIKAGIDPQQAYQQATQIAQRYTDSALGALDNFARELSGSINTEDAWAIAQDFFMDIYARKGAARDTVNELGRVAVNRQTPEVWQAKWQGTLQAYQEEAADFGRISERYRQALIDLANGTPYRVGDREPFWKLIRQYIDWDEQEFRQLQNVEIGQASDANAGLFERIIAANRAYADNSFTSLFHAFQQHPNIDNFDILTSAMRQSMDMGAQAAEFLRPFREKVLARTMKPGEYYLLRNRVWRQYFDNVVLANAAHTRAVVLNGLSDELATRLRWLDDGGVEWFLQGPSKTKGKWLARAADGRVEEFSGATKAGEPGSVFTVPPNVLDDWNAITKGNAVDDTVQRIQQEAAQLYEQAKAVVEPVPEQVTTVVENITNNDLFAAANQVHIGTATKSGAPLNRWLINFINKNMDAKITKLDDLTPEMRQEVMAALRQRAGQAIDEVAAKPAEAVRELDVAVGANPQAWVRDTSERIINSRATGGARSMTAGEAASRTLHNIEWAEKQILGNLDTWLRGTPNQIAPGQRMQLIDAFDKFLPTYDDVTSMAVDVGRRIGDWNMIDFQSRGAIDTAMSLIFPYHVFWSRMPSRMAAMALTKPYFVKMLYEFNDAIRMENERAGNMPQRLQGTLPGPTLNEFIYRFGNPLTYVIPAFQYVQPNGFINPDEANNDTEKWIKRLQQWTPGFLPHIAYLLDATNDLLNPLPGNRKRMAQHQIGDLLRPLRTTAYGIAGLTGNVNVLQEPNIEALGPGWQKFFTLGDEYDYGRIGREMALLVAKGETTPAINNWAKDLAYQVINGVGPLPEQDTEAAQALFEQGVKNAGVNRLWALAGAWLLALPIYRYDKKEQEARDLIAQRDSLGYDPNMAGSHEAVKEFEKQTNSAGVPVGDVVDAMRGYSQLYPRTPQTPVPPTYPYKQPFVPQRPGVQQVTNEKRAAEGALRKQFQEQIDAANEAGDKELRNQLYDERDAQIAALAQTYPSAEPDIDMAAVGQEIIAERERSQTQPPTDPTRITQPEGAIDYYGTYNPKELAAQAEKTAEAVAYDAVADLQEQMNAAADVAEAGTGSWDTYYDLKAERDATWEATKQQMLEDPNALVFGRPTGEAGTAVTAQDTTPITSEDIAEDKAAILAESKAKAGKAGGADSEGRAWSSYWDEYRALGDDYDAKRRYMMANPEFAAYYKAKYGEENEVMWWEKPFISSAQYYTAWRGGYSGGGGGGYSGYEKPKYIDRGRPGQAYMFPIRAYESPRYPPEPPQYRAPDTGLSMAQIAAMIGPRRGLRYTS